MSVARLVVSLLGAMVVAAGCDAQSQSADPPPQASSNRTSPTPAPMAPTTISQFHAQWIGIDTSQPWNWEESDREITSDFQRFGFRPRDETELPRRCNGCGVKPPTAFLTVYGPDKFDPTQARTGQPVDVDANSDGFLRPSDGSEDAMLAWQYADDAWATVLGRTTKTSELDQMLELAHAIRPADRTPIRVPMSLSNVPAQMPLAEISIDRGDYGTTLHFGACPRTGISRAPECHDVGDTMRVQIWPEDGYHPYIDDTKAVPVNVGGKDGLYEERTHEAGVQVQPGMLVVFELSPPYTNPPTPPKANLKDILAGVEWAPDPGNEATWRPVAEWAKQH